MFPSVSTSRSSSGRRNGRPNHSGQLAVCASSSGWLGVLIGAVLWPTQVQADFTALHQAAAAALESGQVVAGPLSCREEIKPGYSETPRGAILVGFDIALGQEGVSGLRPIYRVPSGYYSTRGLGVFAAGTERNDYVVQVRARPGYAVGAVRLRQSEAVRAVNLVYRKVKGTELDLENAYESGWAGNTKVGDEVVLEGHGAAVVGILAPTEGNDRVPALGLHFLVISPSADKPSATTFFANGTKETRYTVDPAEQSGEENETSRRAVLISLVMFGLVMLPVLLVGVWFLAVRGRSRRRKGPEPRAEAGQLTLSARRDASARGESAGLPPEIRLRFRR